MHQKTLAKALSTSTCVRRLFTPCASTVSTATLLHGPHKPVTNGVDSLEQNNTLQHHKCNLAIMTYCTHTFYGYNNVFKWLLRAIHAPRCYNKLLCCNASVRAELGPPATSACYVSISSNPQVLNPPSCLNCTQQVSAVLQECLKPKLSKTSNSPKRSPSEHTIMQTIHRCTWPSCLLHLQHILLSCTTV